MSEIDIQVKKAGSSEEQNLMARIEAFELDSLESKLPFSRRLARDNAWEHDYALRVIEEYKRFAFLAMVAGHPVTPSDAVDQAWHLHMIYTESYWKNFCGKILGKPLHHGPTKGGIQEGAKHMDWYTRTLESYRRWFGAEPPEDIWPTPLQRFQNASRFVRVNRADSWIIRKPEAWKKLEKLASAPLLRHLTPPRSRILKRSSLALILLLAAGCTGSLDFFNYSGPQFLEFYFLLTMASFFVAAYLQWALRKPARSATAEDLPVDPYAMAYLAAGPARMTESAFSELLRKGALTIGNKGKIQATASPVDPTTLHPAEIRLLAQLSQYVGKDFSYVQERLAMEPDPIADELCERGLILSEPVRGAIRNATLALVLLAPSIGLIKVLIGLSRDKPVGLLLFGIVITVGLAIAFFGRKPLRTRLGDEVLKYLRDEYAPLRVEGALESESGPSYALPIAVGLFGMPMLANSVFANDYAKLRQSYQGSSGDFGSSGCGTSGDSGSDSGSGCGSGCGGCGGGGD